MKQAACLCICTALLVVGAGRVSSAQDTHLIVITGVEGDAEHGELFHKWATSFIDAARRNDGVAEANITYLAEKPDTDRARIKDRSSRENVEKAFRETGARLRPADELFVVLFGHGSFDGRQSSFNLPGPDLTADEYAKILTSLPTQRIVFVNTSSSSGGFLQPLAGPGRAIVTATRTGGERNEPRFAEFFVDAFASEGSDKNRDGHVSVQEAFEYARAKVADVYQKSGNILTEHASLEDGNNGAVAATLFLASQRSRAGTMTTSDPALRALLEERQALEDQIAALKLRKASMKEDEYDKELERLATELALKTRAIQQMDGKKPTP